MLLATFKNLVPQPRDPHQPRNYVGRHRQADPDDLVVTVPAPDTATEPERNAA